MNNFRFDSDRHEYWLCDKKLLSCTEILKICGLIDDSFYTYETAQRGKVVHYCCHYLAEGDLDWTTVDPIVESYVRAYEKFRNDIYWRPTHCEVPMYHKSMIYGVTPDQYNDDAVLEIKSGTMQKWTAIQTALQAMAIWPDDYMRKKRFGVELRNDGSYGTKVFDDINDFNTAIGCVSVANWKVKNK